MFVTTFKGSLKSSGVSLKKNLVYNFLLSISQMAFPLLSIPYISRVLNPSGIGSVSFIDSLTYYFIVIAEFGIVSYGIREVARKRNDKAALDKLVSELLSLHLITSLISIIIYSVLVFFLYNKIGDSRLLLFSFSFLLVNAFSCEWYFWGTEKFQYITIRTLITRVLGLISLFLLVNAPDDFIIYYGIICVSAILNILWNFKNMFSEVKLRFRRIDLKGHVRQVFTVYLISLTYSVPLLLDNVLLGLLSTTAAVAYYAFAMKIVRISTALITDSFLVFYPNAVHLIKEEKFERSKFTFSFSSELIFLITIPMGFGFLLIAKDFTTFYLGEGHHIVATNLMILCFLPFIKSFSLFLNKQVLMPYNKDGQILKSLVLGMLVYIIAAISFNSFVGSSGASIAIMLSEISVLTLNLVYVRRITGYIELIKASTFWQAFFSSLAFIPIIYWINSLFHDSIIKVVLAVSLCLLVYCFSLLKIFKNSIARSLYESFLIRIQKSL